jgi:hypothetical protein
LIEYTSRRMWEKPRSLSLTAEFPPWDIAVGCPVVL